MVFGREKSDDPKSEMLPHLTFREMEDLDRSNEGDQRLRVRKQIFLNDYKGQLHAIVQKVQGEVVRMLGPATCAIKCGVDLDELEEWKENDEAFKKILGKIERTKALLIEERMMGEGLSSDKAENLIKLAEKVMPEKYGQKGTGQNVNVNLLNAKTEEEVARIVELNREGVERIEGSKRERDKRLKRFAGGAGAIEGD